MSSVYLLKRCNETVKKYTLIIRKETAKKILELAVRNTITLKVASANYIIGLPNKK